MQSLHPSLVICQLTVRLTNLFLISYLHSRHQSTPSVIYQPRSVCEELFSIFNMRNRDRKKTFCSSSLRIYLFHGWLGGAVVRTLDFRSRVQFPVMALPGYFWDRWPYSVRKLSWDMTSTHINSALHPSGVAESSTSFGCVKGGKITAGG